MKKFIALLLVLVMAIPLVACKNEKLTMGTGGTQGTYYAYGGILGRYMTEKGGIDVTITSSAGSKANIQYIKAGEYQLATVQSDVMSYAWNGTRSFEKDGKIQNFRVIAGLYAEAVQLVTMDPSIKSVADLKGKTVSIGENNSGVYFNAIDVLQAAGLQLSDITPQYQSFGDSADALKDGKIDAAFIVAGAPTPAIDELCAAKQAYLVPIDGAVADKLMADCPFYSVYEIPANTYKGQTQAVKTVTVKATLIVSADVSEDTVYKLTASIFDNMSAIANEHAKGKELSLANATEGLTVPFHPGAAKYFKEKGKDVPTA